MGDPWGHKAVFSVYVQGDPVEDRLADAAAALAGVFPDGFVGVGVELVAEEPRGQGS